MGRGRAPCCEKMGLKKGPWTPCEDMRLISYIRKHGHGNWRALPKQAGLLRCGKSCRLRWTNYLRPDIKRGNFSPEEEETIIKLHELLGNKWSTIASRLPGRTDNEIKNVWNTHLKKRLASRGSNNPSVNESKDSSISSSLSSSSFSSSSSSTTTCTPSSSHSSLLVEEDQLDALFTLQNPFKAANKTIEDFKEDPLEEFLQIPVEPDPEFLDMLEDDGSMDPNGTQRFSTGNQQSIEEVKSTKWITYLENELELWPDNSTQMTDAVQIKPLNSYQLYDDGMLDEEIDPISIYFQRWPSSSSVFNL